MPQRKPLHRHAFPPHFLIDAPGKILPEPLMRMDVNPTERNAILLIGAFAATSAVMLLCKYVVPHLQQEKDRGINPQLRKKPPDVTPDPFGRMFGGGIVRIVNYGCK